MPPEKSTLHIIRASDIFDFTPEEDHYYRLSDNRFRAIFDDTHTLIHAADIQGNTYGEWLSLTLSREKQANRCALTVYGLGVDMERGRWFTDEWYWYPPHRLDAILDQHLPKILAKTLIEDRRNQVEHLTHWHEYPHWFPIVMNDFRE